MLLYLRRLLITSLSVFLLFSTSLYATEMTQPERNEMAAKLVPIINMLLLDGDTTPPAKPRLTTPVPAVASSGTLSVEVNGEAGAKVYVNGVQVGTVGANGKTTIQLSFSNGDNAMTITLKDNAGNESEGLTFTVSYDAPPVITIEGDVEPYVAKGDTFTDLGATAIDANDGAVSVSTTGTVDTDIIGEHNITYSATDSHGNMASKIRKVHVIQAGVTVAEPPMNITKVEGYNGATDPKKLSGIVKNQYWVQDFGTSSEAELRAIVAKYPVVTVVSYSDIYGLLIEIPENSTEANSAIKSIELEEKVANVRHRIYKGADTVGLDSIAIPNDPTSGYNDGGDNWDLEYIDILHAWEITTGSSEVAIGVVDGGFYINHEDITIKEGNLPAPMKKNSHGTAVVSIIAADTNNGKGIAGINWKSAVVGSIFKDLDANISYSPAQYFGNIFDAPEDKNKVKLVNCSFGPTELNETKIGAYKDSKQLYDVINYTKYKNKLFIFSAGNENGDASLGNGALHLNKYGKMNKTKDNVIIVAALLKDGTLPYYSNYGETVDIAAPTSIRTAKKVEVGSSVYGAVFWYSSYYQMHESKYYGTDYRNIYNHNAFSSEHYEPIIFNGTSAAAPVVTGVASLIYSLNPDFTPQEVKKILIDSTNGHKACLRHTTQDYTFALTEDIPGKHCIPILNAGNALALAKKIVEAKKAHLLYYYPSVFSNLCNVYIKPPTSSLQIKSLDLSVQGKKRSDDTWEPITVAPSDISLTELADNSHELAFPTDTKYSEYNVTGTLKYQGYASIPVELIIPHTIVETSFDIKDKLSQASLDNTVMSIDYMNLEGKHVVKVDNDVNNAITLYFEAGIGYKVVVKKDTYKTYAEVYSFSRASELLQSRSIEMLSSTAEPMGNLIVHVRNKDGVGISNANITLESSGTIINNIPNTRKSGIAKVLDVPILDNNNEFIEYTLRVVRAGYITKTVVGVGLVDGKSPLLNVTLKKDPNYTNIPPVARAGDDQTISVGESVTLSASASSDEETLNAYLSYKWSGPGIDTSHDENITLTNLAVGAHHIVLEVTDEEGQTSTDMVTVTVTEAGTTTLKKTGQTTSYYTGDDGTYQKGVTPSYSRANEVVTDNVTGLEWQDDAEAKTITKNWADAQTYCSALGLDGGGWRLPTVQELQGIVVDGAYNPSIDTTAFVNYTTSLYYWSSTTNASDTSYAWLVYFYNGNASYNTKSYTNYVRCVR